MNPLDIFRLAFDALKERKLRAALTVTMVAIGAALITGLDGLGAGVNNYIAEQFKTLGANVLIVSATSIRGSSIRITEQTTRMLRSLPEVTVVEPFIQEIAKGQAGGVTKTIIIMGMNPRNIPLIFPAASLAEGKYPPPYDSISILLGHSIAYPPGENRPFAVTGQSLTIELSSLQGGRLTITKRTLRVGGVLASVGTTGFFFPLDRMGFISLSTANSLFQREGNYDGVFVIAKNENAVEGVVQEIQKNLGKGIEVLSAKSLLQLVQNVLGSLEAFIGAIAMVSLIVASVGIFAALYTSVIERTREIGLLKSLGFKNWMILGLFLSEASLIGIIGGGIGDCLGILMAQVLSVMIGGTFRGFQLPGREPSPGIGYIQPIFDPRSMLEVFIFTLLISLISGVYPAWRAARLDPVVALRKE